jgi:1-acyl-sn-glycerol-3-phosphate acyltransferase
MSDHRSRAAKWKRRSITVPSLFAFTVAITLSAPFWAPGAVLAALVRGRRRLPVLRLLAFGVCWGWLETAGVARSFVLWATGRARRAEPHYALMGWWADALMRAMSATTGLRPRVEHGEALGDGNAIVIARHASLGDSLLSAWAICSQGGLQPRYVLKKELLFDPCLDIVGLRIPNHFLDRESADGIGELDALRELAAGIGPGSVGVIFAEGTRANDRKRARALEKIAERDPDRASRLASLRRLLPPRPAGSRAMVEGAPAADVVLAWHTGFDGLDTFGGMMRTLSRPLPPVRFVVGRVPRAEVPAGDEFERWLDERWLEMDAAVAQALSAEVVA